MPVVKKLTKFRPRVRTKNHSADRLRSKHKSLDLLPFRSVVRLGSTTRNEDIFTPQQLREGIEECNTVDSVITSSNKLRMKEAFKKLNVKQSEWWTPSEIKALKEIPFPILAKQIRGSKAKGMVKIDDKKQLDDFLKNTDTSNYYFEKFYNYSREYRLHMSSVSGEFMSWRKLRRNDEEVRWFFNNSNCNWVNPEHELFDKPKNWDKVVENCKNALKAVGLDIGACDVRIQSNSKKDPDFIVCEINSAPALGSVGIEEYRPEINKILKSKRNLK